MALLKESSTLRHLSLELSGNRIGDAGAQALATLKESTTIRSLNLGLGANLHLSSAGVTALLATLRKSTTLPLLRLDLRGNGRIPCPAMGERHFIELDLRCMCVAGDAATTLQNAHTRTPWKALEEYEEDFTIWAPFLP